MQMVVFLKENLNLVEYLSINLIKYNKNILQIKQFI